MNWYNNLKLVESFNYKDLGKGFGVGLGLGLPFLSPNLDKKPINPAPNQNINVIQENNVKPNNIEEVKPTQTAIEQKPNKTEEESVSASGDFRSIAKEMLIRHEGYRHKKYLDSKKIPTIGIGFNLTRSDAKEIIKNVGANYNLVLNGQQSLNDKQIDLIFDKTFQESVEVARSLFSSFDNQPDDVKAVLVDMSFNLGPKKFGAFHHFIKAIDAYDYAQAYKQMIQSAWYGQVKHRSVELSNIIKNHINDND